MVDNCLLICQTRDMNKPAIVTTRTVYRYFGIPVWVRTRKVEYKSAQHLTGAQLDAQVAWLNAR